MKIKEGYILREVAGTPVVVPLGHENTFRNMLKLNSTGKLLWEMMLSEASEDALVAALTDEYEIDAQTAKKDVSAFLSLLRGFGVLEE